jgi:chromosome segregation ATPase
MEEERLGQVVQAKETELQGQKVQFEDLEQQLRNTQQTQGSSEKVIRDLQTKLQHQENAMAAEIDRLDAANQQIAGLKQEVQNLERSIDEKSRQCGMLDSEVGQLRLTQDEMSMSHQRETSRVVRKLETDISQLTSSQQQMEMTYQRELQTHQERIGKLEGELAEVGTHSQSLDEQLHKSRMEEERLGQVVQERENELQSRMQQYEMLSTQTRQQV